MPAGQTLGPRAYYRYVSDAGTEYSMLLDETTADAMGLEKNATLPTPPLRFRPRVVLAEAIVAGTTARKRLVALRTSPGYASNVSVDIAIDGVTFKSTGRVGEKMSFASNPTTPTP